MLRLTITTIMLLFLSNSYGASQVNGSAEFLAEASPGFLEIEGKGAKVKGELSSKAGKISGKFECQLDMIKTGIELRDKHLKERYLETAKYPTAKFELYPVKAEGKQSFRGKLLLHGVEKEISGEMSFSGRDVEAQFTISTSDFNIEQASYKVVTVGEDVRVKVRFTY